MKSLKKHKYELAAAGLSLLWILVCLASKIAGEANDDIAIAFMIAHTPEHLCVYAHPAYTKFLGVFFDWIPQINWWDVFQLLGITVVVYAFILMSLRRFEGSKKWLAVVTELLLIYVATVYRFTFTRTAGLISMAGAVLAVECICDPNKKESHRILTAISAIVLMLWGSSIRENCFLLCIPFCAGYFVSKLFCRIDVIEQLCCSWRSWLKRAGILSALLLAVFVYLKSGEYWLKSDPAWAEYIRYNDARTVTGDYEGLPAYKDNRLDYEAIGVSELDLEMVEKWATENTESITTEKMIAIAALSDVQIGWKKAVRTVLHTAVDSQLVFVITALIALVGILAGGIIDWLYIACISVGAAAIALYFSKIGRIPCRVFDVICLNAALTILMGSGFSGNAWSRTWKKQAGKRIAVRTEVMISRTVLGLVLAAACSYIVQGFSGSAWYWERWNRSMQRARTIEEQNDRVYVLPLFSSLSDDKQAYGLWSMPLNGVRKNIFYLGGWETRAPYYLKIKEQQGVSNPFTALVEKINVYSTENGLVQDWLSEYYRDDITVSVVDKMDDVEIIQYSKTIMPEDTFDDKKQYDLIISEDDNCLQIGIHDDRTGFEQYKDIRLNLMTADGLRTFRLQKSENDLSARLYDDYEIKKEQASLIALKENGEYGIIADLNVCWNK